MKVAVDSRERAVYLGSLCNAMVGNLYFLGVCEIDVFGNVVLHDIYYDIEFVVDYLPDFYCCSGIDMCSLPGDALQAYLEYAKLK